MLRYYKRHKLLVIATMGISILTQLLTPVSAIMQQRIIDLITAGNMDGFRQMLWVAGAIVLGTALAYFLGALTEKSFEAKFCEDLRNDLYDSIMRRGAARFEEKDTAEYMSYITSNASTVSNNLAQPVFFLISYGISALVVLGIMFSYSPVLALTSIVCGLLSMILPMRFNKTLGKQVMTKMEKAAALNVQMKEALSGHSVVSAFLVFPSIRRRFIQASSDVAKTDQRMGVTISGIENIAQVMDKVVWFITFLVAGTMAVEGRITIGTLVMFISLFSYFSGSMTTYAQLLPLLLSSRENNRLMLSIIDENEAVFTGTKDASCEQQIEVKNLSFRYTKDVPVLEHLNLTLRRNEKVALLGASGCGKSTLIKLLSGHYADYTGSIRYDGTELHDIDPQKLRRLVTVIHQNTFLFNDTIRFNICLGEEFSDAALQNALYLSGADRFISALPEGVDSPCGENGALLSGGQKQRIALARALIRGVSVLILDEGVSAIDVATANEIESELLHMENLTLLTITHRIKDGLTAQYDRVLTMENGALKEGNGVK